MTKVWRIVVVGGMVLASGVGLFLWQASRPREPIYEGRTLTTWLEGHVPTSSVNPPFNSGGWRKADEALRKIGTNAIPTLVKMIRAKDPPRAMLKLLEMARQKGWIKTRYRYASQRHEEAEYAFQVLRGKAASAVPELIKIYEKNVSASSQRCAARALGHIGRQAQAALPVLIRQFSHTNDDVRFNAVSAVMDIGGDPSVVVPALRSVLKDPNVNVRWNAVSGLSRFESRARSAVYDLLEMLNDKGMVGSSSITQQVETALWRIAPEKVGRPLVIEDSTPVIVNGVTTRDLKVTFYGKPKTLIPAGKSVPAVAQYWSSDPRPRVTLYRGGPLGAEDHFLGAFEVMDVPSSADVNISTLCVIANGEIVLCARDNTRERFLEIRRVKDEPEK